MPDRDASGVPTGLRELIEVLAQLAEVPYPADSSDPERLNRYREVKGSRQILLSVQLSALADVLRVGDQYPSIAAAQLARDCERRIAKCREVLAEPLGYETETGEETPDAT